MSDYPDFTDGQKKETEPPVSAAPSYDFFEHVAQQNKRDDDSRVEYRAKKEPLRIISYSETCERCGRDLRRAYIWNGKRLCRNCVEEEQEKWVFFTGGPNAPPQRVPARQTKRAKGRPLMESLISGFLTLFGLKRIEKEAGILAPRMPMRRARYPAAQRPDKKQMPKAEGIMNSKRNWLRRNGIPFKI